MKTGGKSDGLFWFKFWSSRFLTDPFILGMPDDAFALMVRMRCVCNLHGSCPSDPAEVARLTLTREAGIANKLAIAKEFFVERGGRFFDAEQERDKARTFVARRGAQAANANRRKSREIGKPSEVVTRPDFVSPSAAERDSATVLSAVRSEDANGKDADSDADSDADGDAKEVRSKKLDARGYVPLNLSVLPAVLKPMQTGMSHTELLRRKEELKNQEQELQRKRNGKSNTESKAGPEAMAASAARTGRP